MVVSRCPEYNKSILTPPFSYNFCRQSDGYLRSDNGEKRWFCSSKMGGLLCRTFGNEKTVSRKTSFAKTAHIRPPHENHSRAWFPRPLRQVPNVWLTTWLFNTFIKKRRAFAKTKRKLEIFLGLRVIFGIWNRLWGVCNLLFRVWSSRHIAPFLPNRKIWPTALPLPKLKSAMPSARKKSHKTEHT